MIDQKWICNKCGAETKKDPQRKNSTCKECGRGRYQNWKLCECGEWFKSNNGRQMYCSKECGYKHKRNGGKLGKHYESCRRARIAICPVCGKSFRAVNDYVGRTSVYCSKECWSKRATVEKSCRCCGKKIITYKSANKKFCSNECRNADYRKRRGELAARWEGGKTEKSRLLKSCIEYKEWRDAVFDRDNYTCQQCGKQNCKLEAHHIKEQCNFPELVFDVSNGITLCHECHKKTDNYGSKAKKRKKEES